MRATAVEEHSSHGWSPRSSGSHSTENFGGTLALPYPPLSRHFPLLILLSIFAVGPLPPYSLSRLPSLGPLRPPTGTGTYHSCFVPLLSCSGSSLVGEYGKRAGECPDFCFLAHPACCIGSRASSPFNTPPYFYFIFFVPFIIAFLTFLSSTVLIQAVARFAW